MATRTPITAAAGSASIVCLLARASLDTVSFMPLVSADPFGGVIITDWYTPPKRRTRFQGQTLYPRPGLARRRHPPRCSRQQQQAGTWIDAPVALNTATDLGTIPDRARG